ncbi:AraC family transcriptional regulator [Chryseobacterium sp. M5A1_1a]
MSTSFQNLKFEFLDNIELFSSENEIEYFPFHAHDYFCVSLICKGTELLQTTDGDHYAVSGMISITQANEVHKNSSIDTSPYSYKTFYINPEVLKFYNNGKTINQLQRTIDDMFLFQTFNNLSTKGENRLQDIESALKKLVLFWEKDDEKQLSPSFPLIDELADKIPYIPIDLEGLSEKFFKSKFHFAREFKKAKGISPLAYIMLKRLKNAKRMLLQGENIQTVCYLMGFYDAAHLNTAFKRFFGITLKMIKNSNIIQEI